MSRATFNVQDVLTRVSRALPSAGSTTVNSDAIDLGALTYRGARLAEFEMLLEAPALNATQLPNTQTMTYHIQMDDTAGFSSAVSLFPSLIVQTGSGGAGAGAASARRKLPTDCRRYIRVQIVSSSGTGDASGVSATLGLRY